MGLHRVQVGESQREILKEGLVRAIERGDWHVDVANRVDRRRRCFLVVFRYGVFDDHRHRVQGRRAFCQEVLHDVRRASGAIRHANVEGCVLGVRMIIVDRARATRGGLVNFNARYRVNRRLVRQLIEIDGGEGLLS